MAGCGTKPRILGAFGGMRVLRRYPVPVIVVMRWLYYERGRLHKIIRRQLLYYAGGGTRTHTRLPSPDFESDKDCGMARDAALRGAFMSLFAFLCGIVRVLVRPNCHQNSHHVVSIKARDYGPEKVSEK